MYDNNYPNDYTHQEGTQTVSNTPELRERTQSQSTYRTAEGVQGAQSQSAYQTAEGVQGAQSQSAYRTAGGAQGAQSQSAYQTTGGAQGAQSQSAYRTAEGVQGAQSQSAYRTAGGAQGAQSQSAYQTAGGVQGAQSQSAYQTAGGVQGAQSQSTYRMPGSSTVYGSAGTYHYGSDNAYPNDYVQAGKKKAKPAKGKRAAFFKKAAACVALGLFFGVFAGLGFYVVDTISGRGAEKELLLSEAETDDTVTAASGEVQTEAIPQAQTGIKETDHVTSVVTDVTDVVAEVMPAIVSISNHYTETISYFGQAMTSEGKGSGSGIIVGQNESELLVVTNYHVIEGADSLKVKFVEDSETEAFVKGTDADMDLAVIAVPIDSIEASTLGKIAVATLGDSDALTVGEPAIAIGNSLGYGQSVTTGVISALNRSIELSDGSEGTFIQTDAAINPGNSGGALLNIQGEVIGINSNKIGGSTIEGMGYAIPISAANPIIAELMLKETKNKVAEDERGYLGISGITVTPEVVQTYGMPEGVYVVQVYEGTPAEQAGLQKGDIITEFAGETIASMDELQQELEFHAKGETVEVTIKTVGNGGYEDKTVSLVLGNKVEG